MRLLLLPLVLPCLSAALTLTQVSVPKENGVAMTLADGDRLSDGTWVVGNKEGTYLASSDKGATWTKIPAPAVGDTAEIMGRALVSRNGTLVWTMAKGWHGMTMPASWSAGTTLYKYVGSEGIRARQVGSKMTYYKTSETWETWTEWFTVDTSGLPSNLMNPSGFPALGKVWFSIEDSGYARGTADGTTWSRMSIPSFAPLLMLTSERSGGIVTATGFTESFELRMGYSVDTGRTWVEGGLDSPGSNVLAVEGGYYLGATGMASDDADLWITRSLGSNWETMGAGCGFFSENGIAHVVKPDGIYTVSGVGTGISRKAGAIALGRVSRQGGRLVARLDASLVGRSWSLVTASGTVQSRGVADGAEITLPHLRGAGWLKVGDATMAVPAF